MLIVGEAPGRATSQFDESLVRQDLADLCDCHLLTFTKHFARTNLLPEWPGRSESGKGDLFPLAEARKNAALLVMSLEWLRFKRIVLLGRRVERAFGWRPGAWFQWYPLATRDDGVERKLAVSPHPSKVSRWWNSSDNVMLAAEFWYELNVEAAREWSRK